MKKVTLTSSRKTDHIRINLEEDVTSGSTTGLERYHFTHEAVPDLDLKQVDTQVGLFGKTLLLPLVISSMTGGSTQAGRINRRLSLAAQEHKIGLGVGSQRAAIENPNLSETFQVRKFAPDILLFANLGAVQLNYGYDFEDYRSAIEMIDADALILHFNPLQEAVQPEGDTNFSGLLPKIEKLCRQLTIPVIAKEVGWGFSESTARRLVNAGIAAIDVAGVGGTSWSQVEMHRAKTLQQARLAAAFANWGIPTSDSILLVRKAAPHLPIIASGGLRSGLEIAKCIALGADVGGIAGPFLKAADTSVEAVTEIITSIRNELRVCMFACGAKDIPSLKNTAMEKRDIT